MRIMIPMAISFFLAIDILYVINRRLQKKNARPLLPGPEGIPILGNTNDMAKPGMLECHPWLQHKDLYDPISSVTILGQTFIIINDLITAFEVSQDRSAIHSLRPSHIFSSKM
jgi:hypothetical protein